MSIFRNALYGCAAAAAGTTMWVAGAHAATTHPGSAGHHPDLTHVAVTGQLEIIGGPAPGAPRPVAGTVSWDGRAHGTVDVAADGTFAVSLQPGRYKLTGHSEAYGDGNYVCQASKPLLVRPGAPAHVDVYCQMR